MKKKIILTLSLVLILIGFYSIFKSKNYSTYDPNKIQIATSFYPYYFLTEQIGGSKVNVFNLTPAGAEPHDYEPTQSDVVKLLASKLIILNGKVEPWAGKIETDLKSKNVPILKASENLSIQTYINDEGEKSFDPHTWLNPKLFIKQAEIISEKIIEIDPENNSYYKNNTKKLIEKLEELDKKYVSGLSNCMAKTIVTSHAAFGYLAAEYNLKQVTISGISPDEEPSLKQLAEVAEFARKNHVKYIFFESLVSPKLSETVANEIGAQTLTLNPIEGLSEEEISQRKNYLTEMELNLHNLRTALECK